MCHLVDMLLLLIFLLLLLLMLWQLWLLLLLLCVTLIMPLLLLLLLLSISASQPAIQRLVHGVYARAAALPLALVPRKLLLPLDWHMSSIAVRLLLLRRCRLWECPTIMIPWT